MAILKPDLKRDYPELPDAPACEISGSPSIAFEEGWTMGCIHGWTDGFNAACEQIQSLKLHTDWGPKATPEEAQRRTLEIIKMMMKPKPRQTPT